MGPDKIRKLFKDHKNHKIIENPAKSKSILSQPFSEEEKFERLNNPKLNLYFPLNKFEIKIQ